MPGPWQEHRLGKAGWQGNSIHDIHVTTGNESGHRASVRIRNTEKRANTNSSDCHCPSQRVTLLSIRANQVTFYGVTVLCRLGKVLLFPIPCPKFAHNQHRQCYRGPCKKAGSQAMTSELDSHKRLHVACCHFYLQLRT